MRLKLIDLPRVLPDKLRSPLGVVLGGSRDVSEFLAARASPDDVCYQMDLFNSEQLERELAQKGSGARVCVAADLWDLPDPMQTLVYAVPAKGERSLKLDMIEQSYHALRPGGCLITLAEMANDSLVPELLRRVFGKLHVPPLGLGHVYWVSRRDEKPRRRHEITYQVRQADGVPLRFVSRPGVFSYGKFDNGARALVETMEVEPGDKIVDVGCGCGTNGVHAGLRAGAQGLVVFVDSNLRALALSALNARANGVNNFRTVASARVEVGERERFDVALANPPYFGNHAIAQLFIERSRALLRPGGRFYLVTKDAATIGELVAAAFNNVEMVIRRGYAVFCALAS